MAKVPDISTYHQRDDMAKFVACMWEDWDNQRITVKQRWQEIRNYLFATDTTHTIGEEGWHNSTTIPKLCQIRDNLHSNYFSALFPNDEWLQWQALKSDAQSKEKAWTVQGYMQGKINQSNFKTQMSKLVYDYIDYGNAFATVRHISERKQSEYDPQPVTVYHGFEVVRIDPRDIVFDPTANSFQQANKIVRSVMTLGEIAKLAEVEGEANVKWSRILEHRKKIQALFHKYPNLRPEDFEKAAGYQVDGFGDLLKYYRGNTVEILEFYGDYYNSETEKLDQHKVITVADRCVVVRDDTMPQWKGRAPIFHAGWRFRQDNLWAMSVLENLVGMQYRIDHLENSRADAVDLMVNPPMAVQGDVEPFVWAPGTTIHLDENGAITPLSRDLSGYYAAGNDISMYMELMELCAGAPREAMGIRTAGEKTAFEVQQLQTASGRIFQEKISQFEIEMLEPLLNYALELSIKNFNQAEEARIFREEINAEMFITVTREDISSNGVLKPVGARHFSKEAQDLNTLMQFTQTPLFEFAMPHVSGEAVAKMIENMVGLKAYHLFEKNVQLKEQKELAVEANAQNRDLQTQLQVDEALHGPTAPIGGGMPA